MRVRGSVAALTLLAVVAGTAAVQAQGLPPPMGIPNGKGPAFRAEPFWPKPLPGNWILGQVSGIDVAPNGLIWVLHRPATLLDDEKGATKIPPETTCCTAAPPVLAFDAEGNLVRHWGGNDGDGFQWPKNEHGLHVDAQGNVYIGGNAEGDQVYKFTPEGKFLMQFGREDGNKGSNAPTRLGRPAHMVTDPEILEVYVADGYGNRRVIVFDAQNGTYKRHWGAYGEKPSDDKQPAYDPAAPLPRQFANPVHCVRLSRDGLVYVCDRANDRIQVFTREGKFVKEFRVEPMTRQNGSVWDLVLSEDAGQKYLFVADGANGQILTLERESGALLDKWGRHGRQPGQFKWVHNMAIDAQGNIYTAEVGFGRRVQKFLRTQ